MSESPLPDTSFRELVFPVFTAFLRNESAVTHAGLITFPIRPATYPGYIASKMMHKGVEIACKRFTKRGVGDQYDEQIWICTWTPPKFTESEIANSPENGPAWIASTVIAVMADVVRQELTSFLNWNNIGFELKHENEYWAYR